MLPIPGSPPDPEELYDKIYRYCYFRLRQADLAQDVTQETFLRFLSSGSYRESGKALHYLYSIARNLCIDQYRKSASSEVATDPLSLSRKMDPSPGPEDALTDSLCLKAALSELDREDQELLLLRYVNEVPVNALCRLLGISRFALYRRLNRALRQLRSRLQA